MNIITKRPTQMILLGKIRAVERYIQALK